MMTENYAGLTQLGHATTAPTNPDEALLERVPNPHPEARYLIRFAAPEFTSLCPLTGQPDFAHLVIDYVPRDWIVESKSLKLFLGSFRNVGSDEGGHPHRREAGPDLAAHRRLLVSTRRYSHRRLLANRCSPRGRVGARPGSAVLSWTWLKPLEPKP